ncbi:SDR family NAD(P)-dependent oxidoreductase [Sphingomonas sp. BN140010]|uniref:SDR family NAD(P)-dependent oxidoreductase n=1 Tax=Sphingomonas arvum TaxID=2992113 RepID=A0ABT3JD75_9SPHN|nr:SDR family NAD(P)-dependent oxidoreductase [Sphingomonas sp. BN140010]MCW3796864.1 SDR family NAD(P)-dependent oxidoreductase [Sphingomonas sp. BN140010]
MANKLAVVTGASSGIGLELAKLAAGEGYDLIVAADTPFVDAAAGLKDLGVNVEQIEADLATEQGVKQLVQKIGDRQVDALAANAGHGLGHAFLDQQPRDWMHVIETNITGTLLLIQPLAKKMVARGEGKILITGSIAGHLAGSFQAVYNGTKAFVDSFAAALNNELKDTGVTVTCLKPGATETEFFERADLEDTKVGQAKKDDPADVAKTGWEAMKDGKESVVYGLKNKAQVWAAGILPESATAVLHRQQAEPGSGKD